ncbi:MAG: hypothetical protein V4485_02670 [Pseudomonadota bacterium]
MSKIKFSTGSAADINYEKGYDGNLNQTVRDKCKEFSEAVFRTYKTGFAQKAQNLTSVKQKLQELKSVFISSGNQTEEYVEYLEFLIKHKGNHEFIIPYYAICNEVHHPIDQLIGKSHDAHHFGLLGTVDNILSQSDEQ